MEQMDMKIPFGEIVKYISERNVEELGKLCDKYKVFRYSSQSYLENLGMEKSNTDDLINIGYNRALIDIMQAIAEEMRTQNAINSINIKQKDEILSILSKQAYLSGKDFSDMIGLEEGKLANIIDEMNGDVRLVNVEQVGGNRLYSIAPKGYKYITSK